MGKTALRKRYESISGFLAGFNRARLHEYQGLMMTMKKHGISDVEFRAWLRFMRADGFKIKERTPSSAHYFCPECGRKLGLSPVNSMSCDQVGGDYTSMFSCSDAIGCGYSRYSIEPVEYWVSILSGMSKQAAIDKMMLRTNTCGGCGGKKKS